MAVRFFSLEEINIPSFSVMAIAKKANPRTLISSDLKNYDFGTL
jgi:hypothetical protein